MQIIIDLFTIMPPPADKSAVPTVACTVDFVGIGRGPVADLARLPGLRSALADTVREHFHGIAARDLKPSMRRKIRK